MKVIVLGVFHEWDKSAPAWVSDIDLRKKYGFNEIFVYQRTNPNSTNYVPLNRGSEGTFYLRYIVEHYDNFPDVAIFVHSNPADHNKNWLNLVRCISPNASYINNNFGQHYRRSPQYFSPLDLWVEQCWRDIIQVTLDLKNNTEEL
jgi:hypothetical protein